MAEPVEATGPGLPRSLRRAQGPRGATAPVDVTLPEPFDGPETCAGHGGGAEAHPGPAARGVQAAGTSAGAVRAMSVTSASMIERRNAAVPSSVTVPSSSKRPGVDWM
ncbi:hypothetical protein QE410_000149 [Microbacterium sp. SORGH_AS 1204]|nr:hypothetical protein [Microbacterium sp. SORGH_AS_1204]